jgi:hypothetical protein
MTTYNECHLDGSQVSGDGGRSESAIKARDRSIKAAKSSGTSGPRMLAAEAEPIANLSKKTLSPSRSRGRALSAKAERLHQSSGMKRARSPSRSSRGSR